MEERDFYVILGVAPTESADGIREAFRQLARRYHPDRAGADETARFQQIVEAYATLADPERRRRYNEHREAPRRPASEAKREAESDSEAAAPEPLVPEPVSIYRDFDRYGPSLPEIRRRFRRNFTGEAPPKSEGVEPLTLEIVLSPDEAARGGSLPVSVPVYRTCPLCDGTGREWGFPCLACGAEGLFEMAETVELHLPPHVRDRSLYDVPIQGLGIHNFTLRVEIRVGR